MKFDCDRICRVVIHPAIGVARVGNSKEFFYASEIPGRGPDPSRTLLSGPEAQHAGSGFKDLGGQIKKQAARFRVYALDDANNVLGELTSNDANIAWTVHIANRKAIWYNFVNPLDLPNKGISVNKRNTPLGQPADRELLLIDPGPADIEGPDKVSKPLDATFMCTETVHLGQLLTDADGRLVVIGGNGSAGHLPPFNPIYHFANNDAWYDDISDGTVRAKITIQDAGGKTRALDAEPALVVVTPPNYAPGLFQPTMMQHVVEDLYYQKKGLPKPKCVSFTRDIYPIFERLHSLQWTNQGMSVLFGAGSESDPMVPRNLERLSSASEASAAYRQRWFDWFRDPDAADDAYLPGQIPPFYGDELRDFSDTARCFLSVTRTQYSQLRQWAHGEFKADRDDSVGLQRTIEDVTDLQERPRTLDAAALDELLGGPFRPAVEVTWVFRLPFSWQDPACNPHAPFRMKVFAEGKVCDDYGAVLTPEMALDEVNGPFIKHGPGTLTRFMGVPWQADAGSCLGAYDPHLFLPMPALWPARIPTEVLSQQAFERLSDTQLSILQRYKYFGYRSFWMRDLDNSTTQFRLNDLATEWSEVGILRARPRPADLEDLPAEIWVEEERSQVATAHDYTYVQAKIADGMNREEEIGAAAVSAIETTHKTGRWRRTYRRNQR